MDLKNEFDEKFGDFIKDVSIGQYDENGVNIGFLSAKDVIISFWLQKQDHLLTELGESLEKAKEPYHDDSKGYIDDTEFNKGLDKAISLTARFRRFAEIKRLVYKVLTPTPRILADKIKFMNLSKKCWFGRHIKCKYVACICNCHDSHTRMFTLLEELDKLNHKQRQEKAQFNPFPPPNI